MFQDNYGFILVDKESKASACIDPGDGKAIKQALDALNIDLDYILCTHKHDDHIGGVADLLKDYPSAVVIATQYEEIPEADRDVGEGETFHLGKLPVQVRYLSAPANSAFMKLTIRYSAAYYCRLCTLHAIQRGTSPSWFARRAVWL